MGVIPFTFGHCLNAFELARELHSEGALAPPLPRSLSTSNLAPLRDAISLRYNALRASMPRRPRLRSDARMFAAAVANSTAVAVFVRLLMLAH